MVCMNCESRGHSQHNCPQLELAASEEQHQLNLEEYGHYLDQQGLALEHQRQLPFENEEHNDQEETNEEDEEAESHQDPDDEADQEKEPAAYKGRAKKRRKKEPAARGECRYSTR